ncbi:MAG TPA: alpha/beta hydrolase-fold protein [Candidatus Acidoferrales bacterium]|nr:alpha/beta hydrolase-fold protein [Candidatus Acidoferrales bacterium]
MKRFAFAIGLAAAAFAQQAPRRIVSPEVLPDRRITFRVSAPKAVEAVLRFSEGGPQSHPMTKGEDGVWSVTIGPVEPEIYTYSFLIDGAKTIDLANPIAKIGASIDASVVEVPGNPPRFDQVQDVPHGSIDIHTYASAVSKTQRGLYVYVPPDYYSQPAKRFPVLYLWHGGGGAEQDWSRDGRAGVVLDNLIALQKAAPMLIVMPNNVPGTPAPGVMAAALATPVPATGAGGANYSLLKRELIEEIIPFVARHYRTIENRESRAIAGLSAGGGTTLNVGLASLDTFAWIAEFSSGIFGGNNGVGTTGGGTTGGGQFEIEKISPGFYKDPAATNKKLKLFYMSCGSEDPRMPFQKKALEDFQSHKINVTFAAFPGAHEWKVWRHSLADLAPKLFR